MALVTDTDAKSLYAVCIIFPILGSLVVAVRFYVRISKRVRLGGDDWTALASLVGLE